jgi:hypothetical protein
MPVNTNQPVGGPHGPLDAPRQSDTPRPLESLDAIPDETWELVRDMLAPYRDGFQKGWELEARRGNPGHYQVLPASRPDSHAAAHRLGFQDGIGWRMEVEAIARKQLEAVIKRLDQEGVKSPLCAFDDPEYLPSRIEILLKERDPKACPAIEYVPPPPPGIKDVVFRDDTPEELAKDREWKARAAFHHIPVEDLCRLGEAELIGLIERLKLKAARRRYTKDDLARVLGVSVNKVKRWLWPCPNKQSLPYTTEDVARISAWLQRIS